MNFLLDYLYSLFYLPLVWLPVFFGPALAAIAIRRSLSILWKLGLIVVCLFYAVLPFLVALLGAQLADQFGCTSDITIYQCPGNSWIEAWITVMVFAHWGAFLTIPSAMLGVIGILVSFVLKLNSRQPADGSISNFYRSRHHKAIAGICAAIAQRWGLSLLGVRIATVVLTLLSPGLGVLLYSGLWLAFPLEDRDRRVS